MKSSVGMKPVYLKGVQEESDHLLRRHALVRIAAVCQVDASICSLPAAPEAVTSATSSSVGGMPVSRFFTLRTATVAVSSGDRRRRHSDVAGLHVAAADPAAAAGTRHVHADLAVTGGREATREQRREDAGGDAGDRRRRFAENRWCTWSLLGVSGTRERARVR